jgi:hypothetical protein
LLWGALLVLKRPLGAAGVEALLCEKPGKGLESACGCEDGVLKIEPLKPPPPRPFVAGVGVGADAAKGLLVPAVKLKPTAVGGCGLKPVFVPLPPKEGNDEVEKELFCADGCVGGKLLVPLPNPLPS